MKYEELSLSEKILFWLYELDREGKEYVPLEVLTKKIEVRDERLFERLENLIHYKYVEFRIRDELKNGKKVYKMEVRLADEVARKHAEFIWKEVEKGHTTVDYNIS